MRVQVLPGVYSGTVFFKFCSFRANPLTREGTSGEISGAGRRPFGIWVRLAGLSRMMAGSVCCLMLISAWFALGPTANAQAVPVTPAFQFVTPGNVGGAAESGTAVVTISAAGSLSAINVVTQGIPNQ